MIQQTLLDHNIGGMTLLDYLQKIIESIDENNYGMAKSYVNDVIEELNAEDDAE